MVIFVTSCKKSVLFLTITHPLEAGTDPLSGKGNQSWCLIGRAQGGLFSTPVKKKKKASDWSATMSEIPTMMPSSKEKHLL